MTTLETSAANSGNGAGTYNIVGKYTNSAEAVKDITDLNVHHFPHDFAEKQYRLFPELYQCGNR